MWKQLLSSLHIECSNNILQQSTNRKLFEMVLPPEFFVPTMQPHYNESDIQLSSDELNTVQTGPKFNQFVQCLGEMAVDIAKSDFFSYTRK